jgi:flagellar basal body-associated protein FliL
MAHEPKNVDVTGDKLKNLMDQQIHNGKQNKKIPSRVLLVNTIIFVVLLLCVGGWFFSGLFIENNETQHETNYYVSIPEVVVNLRSINPKGNILRATFNLQIHKKEEEAKIKEYIPVILDQLLSYLRDQSVSDLEGPGLERMREALLLRINNIVRPIRINRITIYNFLIQ